MARAKGKKLSKKAALARERKRSKRLGYSLAYNRQKKARAASKADIATAKKLSPYVPSLKKLAKKTTLTPAEKTQIRKRAKQLRGVNNLYILDKKQQKALKGLEFAPGVNAIRLRNTSQDATIKTDGKDLIVTSNGRTWIYWRLSKTTVRNKEGQLDRAAKQAFEAQFPIELVAQLADKAFKTLNVKAVTLWTSAGRADQTFASLNQFLRWLHSKLQAGRYTREEDGQIIDETDVGKWVNGLAILINEPKGKAPTEHKATKAKAKKKKPARKSKPAAKRKRKK